MLVRLTTAALVLLSLHGIAQQAAMLPEAGGFALLHQPEVHAARIERLGWTEITEHRATHTASYRDPQGVFHMVSSAQPLYYSGIDGQLQPVDIRPKPHPEGFAALEQANPVLCFLNGGFGFENPNGKRSPVYGVPLAFNGLPPAPSNPEQDRQQIHFPNIAPGVSRIVEFRHGALKYSYLIENPYEAASEELLIEEWYGLEAGWTAIAHESTHPLEPVVVIRNAEGRKVAAVHPLLCFDSAGNQTVGNIEIADVQPTGFRLKLSIPSAWLSAQERQYPVLIDPLVTGPTSEFPDMNIPSCFFPEFSQDGMEVEVPGGITVTNLNVTSNYFASPFTTSVMGDGRMYFSTECNNTVTYQVTGDAALQAGTAYLENLNMNNPLLCCIPQQCEGYSFTINQHISRTSNGNACNIQFIYYDPFSLWPFTVYAEGHTPELYGSEMQFTPSELCAHECEFEARIFVRYGVPPYTFTHPWSDDEIEWGTAAGCSTGQVNRELIMNVPDCPNYCDLTPQLDVPPPVVTDACGTLAFTATTVFPLPLNPTPLAPPTVDELSVCSGEDFSFEWQACLDNTVVIWNGFGQTVTGTSVTGNILNNGTEPVTYPYIAIPEIEDCASEVDSVLVTVYPLPDVDFSVDPAEGIVAQSIQFTDETAFQGNPTGTWFWSFGDEGQSTDANPVFAFSDPGLIDVCLTVETGVGCSSTHCESVTIAPAELVLPNIFTPNNDGINDVLAIEFINQFPGNVLTVYNRWGNVVFEAENYNNQWAAPDVPDGTYFYTIHVEGRPPYRQELRISR